MLFDKDAYKALGWHRNKSRAENGATGPLKWHALLDRFAEERTGLPISLFSLSQILRRGSILFTWQLTRDALLAAGLGRLVYLHWGGVPRDAIRLAALRIALRRARLVLVNDAVAEQEVMALSGRNAARIPMFIDTQFFSYMPPAERREFLFCAGSNDRDPEVLLALAKCGWPVTWLANSAELRSRYEAAHPNLRMISRVTDVELRHLYHTCRVAVMPALRDVHAAGQTTGLEAIACGAPVVMSQCRAATIFERLPSVSVVRESTSAVWATAIGAIASGEIQGVATSESRRWVCEHTDSEALLARLALLFGMPADM